MHEFMEWQEENHDALEIEWRDSGMVKSWGRFCSDEFDKIDDHLY